MNETAQGWAMPPNSAVTHYFIGRQSLCRGWAWSEQLDQLAEPPRDACRECARLLKLRTGNLSQTEARSNG